MSVISDLFFFPWKYETAVAGPFSYKIHKYCSVLPSSTKEYN